MPAVFVFAMSRAFCRRQRGGRPSTAPGRPAARKRTQTPRKRRHGMFCASGTAPAGSAGPGAARAGPQSSGGENPEGPLATASIPRFLKKPRPPCGLAKSKGRAYGAEGERGGRRARAGFEKRPRKRPPPATRRPRAGRRDGGPSSCLPFARKGHRRGGGGSRGRATREERGCLGLGAGQQRRRMRPGEAAPGAWMLGTHPPKAMDEPGAGARASERRRDPRRAGRRDAPCRSIREMWRRWSRGAASSSKLALWFCPLV